MAKAGRGKEKVMNNTDSLNELLDQLDIAIDLHAWEDCQECVKAIRQHTAERDKQGGDVCEHSYITLKSGNKHCRHCCDRYMGDVAIRKDAVESGSQNSPAIPSEISGDIEMRVAEILFRYCDDDNDHMEELEELRPYLRSAEPVDIEANYWKTRYMLLKAKTPKPVSLKECMIAAAHADDPSRGLYPIEEAPLSGYRASTKAVLDAAGVKYVD
jgi:hypothetical protein